MTLDEIIGALEKATGVLDEAIVAELLYLPWRDNPGPWRWWTSMGDAGETELQIDGPGWPCARGFSSLNEWPDRSLDAAIALCERVLPGVAWKVTKKLDGAHFAMLQRKREDGSGFDVWEDTPDRPAPALALCLALLRALRALQSTGGK